MILRPYQVESIGDLREQFRQGHTKIVLAAPTGSGKSVMMLEIIQGAEKKGSRSLFICERRILVEQFSRHLDSIGVDHGVLMANHWRFRPHAKVQVASAQTLERMESWPAFDLVFIDELHACMRKSVVAMLKARPGLKVIGATATPFHPAIAEHFTAITSVISMSDLVDNGSLVPFRVFVAKEIDTLGVPVVAGEWKKDELEKRGQQIVGDIVTDYVRISQEVFGGYRKTICFSCGVAHGADLVQLRTKNRSSCSRCRPCAQVWRGWNQRSTTDVQRRRGIQISGAGGFRKSRHRDPNAYLCRHIDARV